MLQSRVIPCLLLRGRGLVKGVKFQKHQYVGDPINAVRIFNDKEVDEIAFIDISVTKENREPDYELIKDIASECFIPFSYGGGVRTFEQASKIFTIGVERVIVNTAAAENPKLIEQIANGYGSQSVIVSIDVKKTLFGKYEMYTHSGNKVFKRELFTFVKEMENAGAGEILITSIDREGTGLGFDISLVERLSASVSIPVIAGGGAGSLEHLKEVFDNGASAASIGSMFVFHGRHRAVLITYPSQSELKKLFGK